MVVRRRSYSALLLLVITHHPVIHCFSNLTNNDPAPLYSARYPYEYLSAWLRDYYREIDSEPHCEMFCLSISPFRQTAASGKNNDKQNVELGDLYGRWNMLGLFYYTDPCNKCATADPCNLFDYLGLQKVEYGTGMSCNGSTNPTACPAATYTCLPPTITDPTMAPRCPEVLNPNFADIKQVINNSQSTVINPQVGFFSIPLQYRKYGIRFEVDMRIWNDLAFRIQCGFADVSQNGIIFNDLTQQGTNTSVVNACNGSSSTCPQTCSSATGCFDSTFDCKELIVQNIMRQRDLIMKQMGYDIRDYNCTGAEDTRLSLYWQRLIPVNDGCSGWPFFLCVPSCAIEVLAPTSKVTNPRKLFAVPLGNNGHTGIGFTGGLDFDFLDSVQFGIHAGMTRWNTQCRKGVPVPTNPAQSGIYPFTADIRVKPGTNWTFGATLQAHYFLERLSAYGEYFVVNHAEDCITVLNLNTVCGGSSCSQNSANLNITQDSVLVQKMRDLSGWRSHLFNFSLTYDVSPHVLFGFLWQAPLGRTNAYRATTLLGSCTFRF